MESPCHKSSKGRVSAVAAVVHGVFGSVYGGVEHSAKSVSVRDFVVVGCVGIVGSVGHLSSKVGGLRGVELGVRTIALVIFYNVNEIGDEVNMSIRNSGSTGKACSPLAEACKIRNQFGVVAIGKY